jgi:hypothetical protein
LSVDAFQASTAPLCVVACCWKPVGALGGCRSGHAAVDTVAVVASERLLEVSTATIQTSTLCPHVRPYAVYDVPVTLTRFWLTYR